MVVGIAVVKRISYYWAIQYRISNLVIIELVKSPIDPLSISFIYLAKLYFSRDKQIKVTTFPLFPTLNFVYGPCLEVGIFEYFIISSEIKTVK